MVGGDMKPQVTLIQGDCLEVLKTLEPGSVDAVVTDPPYGIGYEYNSYHDSLEAWEILISAVLPRLRMMSRFVVMPSCAIKRLPWWYDNFPPDWLIAWHKGSPGHKSPIGFNSWEPMLCWGRSPRPMHDHFMAKCGFDDNGHPCPKSIQWANWLVRSSTHPGDTILDPFMGSGTTGVACVRTGRNFIGIELDPTYFAIAQKRIADEQARTVLFDRVEERAEQKLLAI